MKVQIVTKGTDDAQAIPSTQVQELKRGKEFAKVGARYIPL